MCIHPHRFCVIIHDCYIDRTQHAVANHHQQNIYRFGSFPLSNSIFFFYNIPMLEVYISKNTFANKKKPYVFRSRNLITYTQEDIINEIDRSGTTFTATETFRPKKGRDPRTPVRDHTISLHFEKDQRFSEELRDMKFKRLGFQKLCVPYISVIKNGIIGKTDFFQPGDSVLIKGRFLKFDYYNSTQGLFLRTKKLHKCLKQLLLQGLPDYLFRL